MEKNFIPYKPEFGTWSGYPVDVSPADVVEVVFTHGDGVDIGPAQEFGWNKSDIASYRKV